MLFEPEVLRVYVVTSSDLVPGRSHLDVARAAVEAGARTVQLRAPGVPPDELRRLAVEVATICDGAGALAIVNDRPDVALEAGCGAHVGQDDGVERARGVLGEEPVLGVSVGTPEEAEAAEAAGADYLG